VKIKCQRQLAGLGTIFLTGFTALGWLDLPCMNTGGKNLKILDPGSNGSRRYTRIKVADERGGYGARLFWGLVLVFGL